MRHNIFLLLVGAKNQLGSWYAYPEATAAFIYIAQHPYEPISLSPEHFLILERYTVVLYNKSSCLTTVNEARRELFCKQNKSLENIPPTQDTLLQHTKRVIIQSNIWTTSLSSIQNIPSPGEWGWKKEDNSWKPV